MNHPRITIFVSPITSPADLTVERNAFGKSRGIFRPLDWEQEIILNLDREGYAPTVNALRPCNIVDIHQISGIVYAEGQLLTINEYMRESYGRIVALIWYQTPISEFELQIVKNHFSKFFGLYARRNILTRKYKNLIETGCLEPAPVSLQIGGSFID